MAIAHDMTTFKPRVLVCDDEPSFVRLLEVNLKRAGFDVVTASDGEEALDRAREDKPTLLLVDILMPKMDGVELVRRFKADEQLSDLPIIVLTADILEGDHERVCEAGADEVLSKPVALPTLMEKVRKFVDS